MIPSIPRCKLNMIFLSWSPALGCWTCLAPRLTLDRRRSTLSYRINFSSPVTILFKNGLRRCRESRGLQQETRCLRFSGESSCETHFPNSEIFPILFSWRDPALWKTLNWCASSVGVTVSLSVTTTFNNTKSIFLGVCL